MKKKKRKSKVIKKILFLIIIVLIICAAFFGYKTHVNGGGMQGLLATLVGNDKETLEELDPIQFLLLGVSTDLGGKITDTIMVATYNPKNQTASLLSIPRDTYTGKDHSQGSPGEKINALYTKGIDKILAKVNELTGLDLKYYMVVDNEALIKLVDVIGGVEFDVPANMNYHDDTQGLSIELSKGVQVLDGDHAEQLLRFRKNDDGTGYPAEYGSDDIGRMKTQRNFIMATAKQTLQAKNIFKIKDIIDIIYEYVDTNISISNIKSYVPYAINFNVDNLKSAVLPGTSVGPTQTGNLYAPYWFILNNKVESEKVIQSLYSENNEEQEDDDNSKSNTENVGQVISITTDETNKIKIELLNASGSKSKLTKVQKLLKQKGYNVKTDDVENTAKTTIVNNTDVDEKYIEQIKELLGVGVLSSNTMTSDNTDITIIIGKDYK
mgnify:CR=1 FL=1